MSSSKIIIIILLLCVVKLSFSQIPSIQWSKCFGGTNIDWPHSVIQTYDGNIVVAGHTYSNDGDVSGNHSFTGLEDIWIIKLSPSGNMLWQKCLGGSVSEECYDIKQTLDSGFIIAGYASSSDYDLAGSGFHGGEDSWIIKTDSLANIQWQRCYGGSDWEGAYNNSIECTADGGYIFFSDQDSNDGDLTGVPNLRGNYLVKIDSIGNIEWIKSYGGSHWNTPASVVVSGSGYYISTTTDSNDGDVSGNHGGSGDIWVAKLDLTGNIITQRCYGGSSGDGLGMVKLSKYSNDLIIAGGTTSNDGDISGFHGYADALVIRVDSMLNIKWSKCIGTIGDEELLSVSPTSDGGCITSGLSLSPDTTVNCSHGYDDFYLVKLDSSGNVEWSGCYGGSWGEICWSIAPLTTGGYVAVGNTQSDDGDVIGLHGPINTNDDFWVIKLDSIFTQVHTNEIPFNDCIVGQNLENGSIILTFNSAIESNNQMLAEIYDFSGRLIQKHAVNFTYGTNRIEFPVLELSSGAYLLNVQIGNNFKATKLLIQ